MLVLKHIPRLTTNIRFISIKSYNPKRVCPSNLGVRHQMKAFKEIPNEFVEDPEGFGNLESDFMEAHNTHKQYEKETKEHKENIRLWIIKNKYFKEIKPNFLTYIQKEQIRLLNSRDPDEWPVERLSEKFPADIDTIRKILKSKWIPKSKERILKHDHSVMENWKLFKKGKIKIDDKLKEHLDKFVDHKFEDTENIKINNLELMTNLSVPEPKSNEFTNIITSCKQYSNKLNDDKKLIEDNSNNLDENQKENLHEHFNTKNKYCPGENETYLMEKISDRRYMRLRDVKQNKNLSLMNKNELQSKNYEYNNETELELKSEENDEKYQKEEEELEEKRLSLMISSQLNNIKKHETQEIEISQNDMKKYDLTPIKQRVHIPRKLWKRNATYKVEDCYYDFDGEFLYRVPGMTGK